MPKTCVVPVWCDGVRTWAFVSSQPEGRRFESGLKHVRQDLGTLHAIACIELGGLEPDAITGLDSPTVPPSDSRFPS